MITFLESAAETDSACNGLKKSHFNICLGLKYQELAQIKKYKVDFAESQLLLKAIMFIFV